MCPHESQPIAIQATAHEQNLFVGLNSKTFENNIQEFRRRENNSRLNLLRKLEPVERLYHSLPVFRENFVNWQKNSEHKKPIKVLLINSPDDPESVASPNKGDYPPLNLWRIGTWAKSKGADVCLMDGTIYTESEIKQTIEKYKPDVLGVSALSTSVKSAIELSEYAKQISKSIVAWGNDHPSQNVKETLQSQGAVDIIFRGEGADRYFGDLIGVLGKNRNCDPAGIETKLANISSVSWRIANGIQNTELTTYDMDQIPIVDTDLISKAEYETYIRNFRAKWERWHDANTTPVITNFARGCHWGKSRCSYCDIADLRIRFMSDFNRIWQEIRKMHEEYGANLVYEVCDNFTSLTHPYKEIYGKYPNLQITKNGSWVDDLVAARPKDLKDKIKWFVYGRADDVVKKGVMEKLKDLGVIRINMGLDHFDDRVLLNNKGINKGSSGATNYAAIKKMDRYGIQGHFSFVVGAPLETEETLVVLKKGILDTIKVMGNLVATIDISPFVPFKGNSVYRRFYENDEKFRKYFGNADIANNQEMTRYVIGKTCQVSYDRIIEFVNEIYALIAKYGYVPGGLGLPGDKTKSGEIKLKK